MISCKFNIDVKWGNSRVQTYGDQPTNVPFTLARHVVAASQVMVVCNGCHGGGEAICESGRHIWRMNSDSLGQVMGEVSMEGGRTLGKTRDASVAVWCPPPRNRMRRSPWCDMATKYLGTNSVNHGIIGSSP